MLEAAPHLSRGSPNERRRRLSLAAAAILPLTSVAIAQSAGGANSGTSYPALGRRLLVNAATFRSELHFHSSTALTYHLFGPDGVLRRTEQVEVRIQEVAAAIYLVTWQEASKTTVVQVQDFTRNVLFSNITRPDGTFTQARGAFELAGS